MSGVSILRTIAPGGLYGRANAVLSEPLVAPVRATAADVAAALQNLVRRGDDLSGAIARDGVTESADRALYRLGGDASETSYELRNLAFAQADASGRPGVLEPLLEDAVLSGDALHGAGQRATQFDRFSDLASFEGFHAARSVADQARTGVEFLQRVHLADERATLRQVALG